MHVFLYVCMHVRMNVCIIHPIIPRLLAVPMNRIEPKGEHLGNLGSLRSALWGGLIMMPPLMHPALGLAQKPRHVGPTERNLAPTLGRGRLFEQSLSYGPSPLKERNTSFCRVERPPARSIWRVPSKAREYFFEDLESSGGTCSLLMPQI